MALGPQRRPKEKRMPVNMKFEMFPLIWTIYDKLICWLIVSGYIQSTTQYTHTLYLLHTVVKVHNENKKQNIGWLLTSAGCLLYSTEYLDHHHLLEYLFRRQKHFLHMIHESIRCDFIWANREKNPRCSHMPYLCILGTKMLNETFILPSF